METDNFELIKKTVEAAADIKRVPVFHENDVQLALVPEGYHLKDLDKYNAMPRRLEANQEFTTTNAFCVYVSKWKQESTLLRGNSREGSFSAVIDYHDGAEDPSWCGHNVKLIARHTPEWKLWIDKDRVRMRQRDFVHFIQDNIADIYSPDSSELLKMVADVKTRASGGRTSSVSNANERRTSELDYTVESGLPELITLSIRPWEHTGKYELKIRPFLYHDDEGAQFMLSVTNADRVLQAAFDDTAKVIAEETGLQVFV